MKKKYATHKLNEGAIERVRLVKEAFSALDKVLSELLPVNREGSLAITSVEIAAMWATKSIMWNDPSAVPVDEVDS